MDTMVIDKEIGLFVMKTQLFEEWRADGCGHNSRLKRPRGTFCPPRKSLSETDLTNAQLQRMYPELSENFR
ncbi:unnamed protein product [Enterobius vermicularis]|uniref:Uncharacterized protein n=1 Tax=Enterobius vermicularis TaxID=51028 RepID=A0A0N4V021_ENTVE|nr:unnamed protein product [Enterobius vermicularis]